MRGQSDKACATPRTSACFDHYDQFGLRIARGGSEWHQLSIDNKAAAVLSCENIMMDFTIGARDLWQRCECALAEQGSDSRGVPTAGGELIRLPYMVVRL